MGKLTRREFIGGVAATATVAALPVMPKRASAAEFVYKYANNLPVTHPMNIRGKEMAELVSKESKGRMEIQIFPNNQLGTDTDTLSQLRSGAIQFFNLSPGILQILVPNSFISGIGFAFKDYKQVWAAMDGDLGAYVRAEIAKKGLRAFEKILDNGYRQTTTSTRPIVKPEDFKGMKLRVPPSPLWTSLFKALGASPASINFAEVYTALQTKTVEGQENPLAIIETARLYEVQKYCSLTNHMWDGFWPLANQQAWDKLPKDLQEIVTRNMNATTVKQREDTRKLNETLRAKLSKEGLKFNTVNPEPFRDALRKAGFYAEWRKKFGEEAWLLLEKYVGRIS
ncbi:MAG TPA: TRAP transporter substrate-binding protein [Nitrospirota bacterium]|nr:TRAP transporter substrate-binding protein [Nitrospirota bacterium]